MSPDPLKQELIAALRGGQAHFTLDEAVANFPLTSINQIIPNGTYTPWHLLEHIRITQKDILDYILSDHYHELSWPDAYWPDPKAQASPQVWHHTINQIYADTQSLINHIQKPHTDIAAPLSPGNPHNLIREVILVATHTSYHLGEFAILRQVMHTWTHSHKS